MNDKWNNASSYESYIGRWSRLVAVQFLDWLDIKRNLDFLDVGCGTGALSNQILQKGAKSLTGIDPSEDYVEFCRESIHDERAKFFRGNATDTGLPSLSFDVIVSGLVLNFIPDIPKALREFRRIARTNATVAAYVWDYAGKMELLRYFWDVAVSLFNKASDLDEAVRFPVCNPARLKQLFQESGYHDISVINIDVPTVFKNFDDFWFPFESGQGPAPGFYLTLSKSERELFKEKIHSTLPIRKDETIHLIARAFAVKGRS